MTVVDHVKLFRNRPDLRFDRRIHEQILPAIRAAGGEVAWTDLYVVHSGSDQSPAGQEKKLERDLRILHRRAGRAARAPVHAVQPGDDVLPRRTVCRGGRLSRARDRAVGCGRVALAQGVCPLVFALAAAGPHDLAHGSVPARAGFVSARHRAADFAKQFCCTTLAVSTRRGVHTSTC